MTTTDTLTTLARLRQCGAIRELAEAMAARSHAAYRKVMAGRGVVHGGWDEQDHLFRNVETATHLILILDPSDPYAMAGLRAVCERADRASCGPRDLHTRRLKWSRLERDVPALLAEALEVLEGKC